MRIRILLLLTITLFQSIQARVTPHDLRFFDFIHYEKNKLCFYGDTNIYNSLFHQFDNIICRGEGSVNILHIGDSHIQADYFSGQIRRRLTEDIIGSGGSRGVIFPYRIPDRKTNDPFNYTWKWTGNWSGYKNTHHGADCSFGIAGNYAFTSTDGATLTFIQRAFTPYPKYEYDIIRIFHNTDSVSFTPEVLNDVEVLKTETNTELGYTAIYLAESLQDTLQLRFSKTDSLQHYFELYGISLENSDGGITYSACGVNGADTEDWLRVNLLEQHLKALSPDLIIISLGTNDVYVRYFNETMFESNYEIFIQRIKTALPDVPIILTTPGDHYRSGMYLNKNTEKTHDIIHALARKYGLAVWDLYTIMGGQNSIYLWHQEGLTAKDYLHYSKTGYSFQGNLFYSALMEAYDAYIEKEHPLPEPTAVTMPERKPAYKAEYLASKKGRKERWKK